MEMHGEKSILYKINYKAKWELLLIGNMLWKIYFKIMSGWEGHWSIKSRWNRIRCKD